MAKKKKNVLNRDKEFNLAVRAMSVTTIKMAIESLFIKYSEEELLNNIVEFKDAVASFGDTRCFNYCSIEEVFIMIDKMQDIILSYSVSSEDKWFLFNQLKESIVDFFEKEDIGVESIPIGYMISGMITNQLSDTNAEKIETLNELGTLFIFFVWYINTFTVKFKNKKIAEITEDSNNKINIKYINSVICDDKTVELVRKTNIDNRKSIGELFNLIVSEIVSPIKAFYSDEFIINNDNKDIEMIIFTEKHTPCPFIKDGKFLLSMDDIMNIPDKRKYGIPSEGTKFEFLNKDSGFDWIEMREIKESVVFKINLINKGNILYLDRKNHYDWITEVSSRNNIFDSSGAERFAKPLIDKNLKLTMIIKKKDIYENNSLNEIVKKAKMTGTELYNDNRDTMYEMLNITLVCLSCMYLAYYNPNMLNGDVRLYNIVNKKKSGYKKGDSYRVPYIRKLPAGYKMSESALNEAKKEGFYNIPEGYTFVSAHEVKCSVDSKKKNQKTIKIKN